MRYMIWKDFIYRCWPKVIWIVVACCYVWKEFIKEHITKQQKSMHWYLFLNCWAVVDEGASVAFKCGGCQSLWKVFLILNFMRSVYCFVELRVKIISSQLINLLCGGSSICVIIDRRWQGINPMKVGNIKKLSQRQICNQVKGSGEESELSLIDLLYLPLTLLLMGDSKHNAHYYDEKILFFLRHFTFCSIIYIAMLCF